MTLARSRRPNERSHQMSGRQPPSLGRRQAHAPPWLPVALVFVIGTTIGVVGTASVIALSQGDSTGSLTQPIQQTQLTRLLGNMDAAAERGDARLFAESRQDLIELLGAAGFAKFGRFTESLRRPSTTRTTRAASDAPIGHADGGRTTGHSRHGRAAGTRFLEWQPWRGYPARPSSAGAVRSRR